MNIHNKIKMLVIDHDEYLKSIKNIFDDIADMLTSTSGEESLVILENNKIDVIILNNITSDLDAIHILHYLKLNNDLSNIPIIVLNDNMNDDFVKKCLYAGATEFIRKPFVNSLLKNRVNRLLDYEELKKSLHHHISEEHNLIHENVKRSKILLKEMAAALSKTIDAKDRYTSGHSERVAEYSHMIASCAKLNKSDINKIYYMALLHDIGKIGVPSRIINSQSKLTPQEFNLIKSHTIIGASILQGIDIFPELAIGAHYHHERFDGKGYPQGLKGETIPVLARLIGVADAYDAMTSQRSYRNALAQDYVYDEIKKNLGRQFDPDFGSIMLDLIEEDKDYQLCESNSKEKLDQRTT
ncbi:MAG: HD domain-containing protein [Desulfovibrionaceae bacterium]|nr:HD domain-containing protein [Desulfovibrionaceae bacterium]